MAMAPHVNQMVEDLMRTVVGLDPPEQVPAEAWAASEKVLERYGTEGLQLLLVSLTGWAAAQTERAALLTGKSTEAILDELHISAREVFDED
ncbi:hypothetical protein P8605_41825 [Streptomyces sp. T-3]|nr:hypothetical protein [Streptomyces sp. T-3]